MMDEQWPLDDNEKVWRVSNSLSRTSDEVLDQSTTPPARIEH